MTVDIASSTSPQLKLINELDRGWVERDVSLLAKPLHEDFHLIIHPQTLDKPVVSKDEWLANIAEVFKTPILFEKPTYHSVVETPGKVVLRSTANVKGLPGGDAADTSTWVAEFATDKDGSLKIKQLEQFTNSADYVDVFKAAESYK